MYQIELVRNDTGFDFKEFMRKKEWLAMIVECAERAQAHRSRGEMDEDSAV
ncbi:MAG: hypothetical protein J0L82_11355 [Deltaproteobacteria bacterium]|jgi:hypothetical protein|nr:hypothetical protein [Deltaproteobacteria bacterium]